MMATTETMLTTVDNPWDPFTHWDEWFAWDEAAGYHTCAFYARIVRTSDELSEGDQVVALERALNEIISENITGLYKKAVREVE
jgi:hypothetical protein